MIYFSIQNNNERLLNEMRERQNKDANIIDADCIDEQLENKLSISSQQSNISE